MFVEKSCQTRKDIMHPINGHVDFLPYVTRASREGRVIMKSLLIRGTLSDGQSTLFTVTVLLTVTAMATPTSSTCVSGV